MEDSTSTTSTEQTDLTELTAAIVTAYVSNNSVPAAELPPLLSGVYAAVAGLNSAGIPPEPELEKPTAGQIRRSIKPDALISFIDGKPYKTLKRHLTKHGMTFAQYRERYGLPRDYPANAPSYSEQRSALAKSLGLGQRLRSVAAKAANTNDTSEAPKKRGRKKPAP